MTLPRLLSILLLCSLPVATAHAAGLNARWSDCLGDAGTANRSFACTSNVGTDILVGSFVLPAAISDVSGFRATLEVAFASATVPAWWQFLNAGSCRQTSGTITGTQPATSVTCVDYAQALAVTTFGTFTSAVPGPNDIRFTVVSALPPTGLQNLVAGPEYFAFTFNVNHQKTVGVGACDGCSVAACINLKTLEVFAGSSSTLALTLSGGTVPGSDSPTWQGGAGVPALPSGACAGPVPTRNSTWNGVKALYR